jgi:hypothetical protein
MSSYFDALTREVSDGPQEPEAFIEHVRAIEGRVYATITQLTGDREFPDDLRERILGLFATQGVYQPGSLPTPAKAIERALGLHYSRLIEDLHEAFHQVAQRRHETRFGRLSDHPAFDLARRDEVDLDQ